MNILYIAYSCNPYFIYIAFTIYMFLDSSAINFVCNLFPDAAGTILNQ